MPALRTRDTFPRSLEVTTDVLETPALAIISPTPRAFTFPFNTTPPSTISPYTSPSCSPFEPDLRTLTITPSPTTFIRTLSPVSPASSVSSNNNSPTQPPIHKRRKSSCSDLERRPKKGDDDYIKRPENAFILFRRKCCEERQAAQEDAASADGPTKKQRQADLSKTISQQWKSLSAEERVYWEELAKEKKKEHEQLYPNYVYRPQRSKDKDGRPKPRKSKGKKGDEQETDSEISFVLPWTAPNRHGRSASAPTPPPLGSQAIQLPSVYMNSCPTSPSLLPMISRRTSHPGHQDTFSQFDFLPTNNNSLMPPPYTRNGEFENNYQNNNFYPDIFNASPQASVLQQLSIPQELLPPDAASIGSNSTGPSSPHHEPYTPINVLSNSFSVSPQETDSNSPHIVPRAPEAEHQSQSPPMDAAAAQQLPMHDLQFPSYEWEGDNMWPNGDEMLLGEDFDLSSIPPIELGLPKYDGLVSVATDYLSGFARSNHFEDERRAQETFESLFSYDDLMTSPGF